MARIGVQEAGGQNVVAYLDMLAFAEGTSTSRFTRDDGYDVMVGGIDLTPNDGVDDAPKTFGSYADHPNKLITVNTKGLKSTAAGRYQQLSRYWPAYKKLLKLPDFGPVSQDKLAIQLIRERRALDDVKAGRIEDAIYKCNNIWASLTGSKYGQKTWPLATLMKVYLDKGGKL